MSLITEKHGSRGVEAPAVLRRGRRARKLLARRRARASQPAGPLAADPRPRARARGPALRPHGASGAAHERRPRPARAQPGSRDAASLVERADTLKGGQTGILRVGAT